MTNPIIELAIAHYRDQETVRVEVPEWGDEKGPLVIYATPFTLAEKKKLFRLARDNDLDLLAYTLIHKACDKDGNKIFTLDDKHALVNSVDADVLARVARQLSRAESPEDIEKNS